MARILVLEDEAPLRALLVDLLEEEGHTVTASGDGRISADPDIAANIDLAITDVMMPDCDGLEVIRNLKSSDRNIRILAISGAGQAWSYDFLPAARALGAQKVLYKPFTPHDLLDVVSRMLDPALDTPGE